MKNRGVYGLWKIAAKPYFDETQVWPDLQQKFPYRFSFLPTVAYLPVPISLSDVLDLRDKGRIWTFDLNPVQQKNQYKITLDEASELLRLLLRNNPLREPAHAITDPYHPAAHGKIDVDFTSAHGGRFRYEGWLNAWFMKSLANGEFKDLLGDYQEFLNLVPTTFNKVMDVFLTHVTRVGSLEVLHKYTCIELKADRATESDLAQLLRYENWLARRLAAGDTRMIQSVLVANRFAEPVIEYVHKRREIEEKAVRLIGYRIAADRQTVDLQEI